MSGNICLRKYLKYFKYLKYSKIFKIFNFFQYLSISNIDVSQVCPMWRRKLSFDGSLQGKPQLSSPSTLFLFLWICSNILNINIYFPDVLVGPELGLGGYMKTYMLLEAFDPLNVLPLVYRPYTTH